MRSCRASLRAVVRSAVATRPLLASRAGAHYHDLHDESDQTAGERRRWRKCHSGGQTAPPGKACQRKIFLVTRDHQQDRCKDPEKQEALRAL